MYLAVYGLLKPAMLLLINPNQPAAVFSILILAGSLGDAAGSIFRVPSELVYKQIQTEAASTLGGAVELLKSNKDPIRLFVISWLAVLLRDMPFAGLQIAFYDVYKNVLSFLDELGWSSVSQQLLWGALAGGTAAYITTPFDLLTTNIMIGAQKESNARPLENKNKSTGIGAIFEREVNTVMVTGGIGAFFQGGFERVLFFAPAGMIFFGCYGSIDDVLSAARDGHAFWQR